MTEPVLVTCTDAVKVFAPAWTAMADDADDEEESEL